MIIGRRRQIITFTVCMIYVICILVIAKRIMRISDSFAFDYKNPVVAGATGNSQKYEDENLQSTQKIFNEELRSIYEASISKWERSIVKGLGDGGKPVELYGKEKTKAKTIIDQRALNVLLSDKIPLNRKLPDVRDKLCANVTYDEDLPDVSVIIIFFNEPRSVLLRTVASVLAHSPKRLLKEIILVDDHSDEDELKGILDYYVETRFPDKVKLIRLSKRMGLIRARLSGAKIATGEVLLFLDAHCEVIVQWLEPLLQRIKAKRNAVVMPIIDNISEETLEYSRSNDPDIFQVGGFTWSGHFTWINLQKKDSKSRISNISPANSPTMAGGLFAIDRKYFWHIGSYDDQMDGWGGENLEMSFRIWQCGGSLEVIPCSRVGHIFRNFHPYKFPNGKDTHGINTARLVYVWMDEYKRLFFMHREEYKENKESIGDLTSRLELRERLKCKSFKWYLDNVYPEKMIPDENVVAYGRVKVRNRNMCLDNLQRDEDHPYHVGLYTCLAKLFTSQMFSLSKSNELRRDELCATLSTETDKNLNPKIRMIDCQMQTDRTEWILTEAGKIVNVPTGLCLDATSVKNQGDVVASPCSSKSNGQFWDFEFYGDKIKPR